MMKEGWYTKFVNKGETRSVIKIILLSPSSKIGRCGPNPRFLMNDLKERAFQIWMNGNDIIFLHFIVFDEFNTE